MGRYFALPSTEARRTEPSGAHGREQGRAHGSVDVASPWHARPQSSSTSDTIAAAAAAAVAIAASTGAMAMNAGSSGAAHDGGWQVPPPQRRSPRLAPRTPTESSLLDSDGLAGALLARSTRSAAPPGRGRQAVLLRSYFGWVPAGSDVDGGHEDAGGGDAGVRVDAPGDEGRHTARDGTAVDDGADDMVVLLPPEGPPAPVVHVRPSYHPISPREDDGAAPPFSHVGPPAAGAGHATGRGDAPLSVISRTSLTSRGSVADSPSLPRRGAPTSTSRRRDNFLRGLAAQMSRDGVEGNAATDARSPPAHPPHSSSHGDDPGRPAISPGPWPALSESQRRAVERQRMHELRRRAGLATQRRAAGFGSATSREEAARALKPGYGYGSGGAGAAGRGSESAGVKR